MTAEQLGAFQMPLHLPFRPSPPVLGGPRVLGNITALVTGELEEALQQGSEMLKWLFQEDARGGVI